MLFPPKSVFDTRARILRDLGSGRFSAAVAYQKLIDLDPEDNFALLMMADLKKEQGDLATAEALLWKAIDLQPGFGNAYRVLADHLQAIGQESLAAGLAALAAQKLMLDDAAENSGDEDSGDEDLDDEDLDDEDPDDEDLEEDEHELAVAPASAGSVAAVEPDSAALGPLENEAPEVTAKLHLYRLVGRVQASVDLPRELVDEVLAEREKVAPLLVGLLRGWARDVIGDSAAMAENVLALLGEIGDPKTLLPLVEFSDIDDEEIAGSAKWAVRRAIELQPQAGEKALAGFAKELSAGQRLVLMDLLTRDRSLDNSGELFRALCLNGTEKLSKKDCDVFVPLAIGAILSTHGRNEIATAKALLRARGQLLSRNAKGEAEYLIDELGDRLPEPLAREDAGVQYTVYDICAGNAVWDDEADEEADDEALIPSPVARPRMPGRNDNCWCGSGRKYKKCHLEADQTSAANQKTNRNIN